MSGRLPPSARSAALGLALGIGGIALLTWSGRAVEDMESRAALASKDLARSSVQRTTMRQLDAATTLALPRYQALAAAGIVGTPRPQDWQGRVTDIARRHRVELVEAQFLSPRPRPAGSDTRRDSPLLASTLALKARLLHEGEVAAFFADVQAQPDALVHITDCALDRLPPAAPNVPVAGAGLALDCRLDWLTIAPVSARGRR